MEDSKYQVNTGSNEFNQIITVLLKTSMFLAGAIGCFLDNTVPGKYSLYWVSTKLIYKVLHTYFSARKLLLFIIF